MRIAPCTRALVAALWIIAACLPLHAAEAPLTDCDRLAAHPDDAQRAPASDGIYEPRRIDAPAARVACTEAMAHYPDAPRFKYQMARTLIGAASTYNRRDCQPGLALLEEAARAGHAEAASLLGSCLLPSFEHEGSRAPGTAWLVRARDMGSITATAGLARSALANAGKCSAEVYRQLAVLERLARAGSIRASASLADLYAFGYWIERDFKKAHPHLSGRQRAGISARSTAWAATWSRAAEAHRTTQGEDGSTWSAPPRWGIRTPSSSYAG